MMKTSILFIYLQFFALVVIAQPPNFLEQSNQLLERLATLERFSGSILVAKEDSILLKKAFGNAQKEINNATSTCFDIGSLTKQFTAAAILQLVYDEKINLHTSINHYLKNDSKHWENITVHHLLTHTSGIPSLLQGGQGLDNVLPTEKPIDINTLIGNFIHLKPLFKAGKRFQYSNSGYVVLAAIIEQVSGQSYDEYMKNNIFKKYGLNNTTVGKPTTNFASPFLNYRQDITKESTLFHHSWAVGAGFIYSTVDDLFTWHTVIHSSNFLNQELQELLFTGHTEPQRGKSYAYGWEIIATSKGKIIQHDGANLGYISRFIHLEEDGLTIIILTNQSHETYQELENSSVHIEKLSRQIIDLFRGESIEIPPSRTPNQNFPIGTFAFQNGQKIHIKKVNDYYRIENGTDSLPLLFRYVMQQPLQDTTREAHIANTFANFLGRYKIKQLKPYMSKDLKLAVNLGLVKIGLKKMIKPIGKMKSSVAYFSNEKYALIHFEGTKSNKDFILYFDKNGEVDGIFEYKDTSYKKPQLITAFPIEANQLLLDGFPFGETDAILKFENGHIQFIQLERVFELNQTK